MIAAPIALIAALALAQPAAPREEQWVYRERQGDGQPRPQAIFLWWDFSHVLFHASCDPERPDTLLLRYFPDRTIGTRDADDHLILDPVPRIAFLRHDRRIELEMGLLYDSIAARIHVTPELIAFLAPAPDHDLGIDAINETGDPWHVGQAEPLHRLARACDDPQR